MFSAANITRSSWLYKITLMLVASTTLLLPVIYVACIGAAICGIYLYVTEFFVDILVGGSGPNLFAVIAALAPILIGLVMVFGMCRPLFAHKSESWPRIALEKDESPAFQQLVQTVSQDLGARFPCRVEFSTEVNASAGFVPGWSGFLGGRLVLTLGTPLIAGLTQQELAGVIAHELGHFRQHSAMRAAFLIRWINHWFARVVYTRSSLDPDLQECAPGLNGLPPLLWVFVVCAEIGSGFARGILWSLMMTAHCIGAALLRQMEYNADRCEALLAGRSAFESTFAKLDGLKLALSSLAPELSHVWRVRRRLPADLAQLILDRSNEDLPAIPPPIPHRIYRWSSWLDTHPSTLQRIHRVRSLKADGIIGDDHPATELFEDFGALSSRVTWNYYGEDMNLPVTNRVVLTNSDWLRELALHIQG